MRIQRLFVTIIMVSLLFGCTKEGGVKLDLSPKESNIIDLTTKEYTHDELTKIANYEGNVHQYNSLYPIECIRDSQGLFRVAYRGEKNITVVYFDQTGKKTLGRIYNISVSHSSFDGVLGCTLDDIMKIDPLGDYTFIYTGRNDHQVSRHYTSDGFIIDITFDKLGIVTDVNIELI